MSYFHTGIRTIIGAEAFHFPVRDGKEWDHLAMVVRLDWSPRGFSRPHGQFTGSNQLDCSPYGNTLVPSLTGAGLEAATVTVIGSSRTSN